MGDQNPGVRRGKNVFGQIVSVNYTIGLGQLPTASDLPGVAAYAEPVELTPIQSEPIRVQQPQQNGYSQQLPRSYQNKFRAISARSRAYLTERKNKAIFAKGLLAVFLVIALLIGLHVWNRYKQSKKFTLKRMQLKGGKDANMGDVLLGDEHGHFGYIDGRGFGLNEAHVVCRKFGKQGAIAFTNDRLFTSHLKPRYAFVAKNMRCNGHERSLNECLKLEAEYFPSKTQDLSTDRLDPKQLEEHNSLGETINAVGVVCQGANFNGVMLVNGSIPNEGNLVALNSMGYLGPVCDDHWGPNDATVACHQLGFSSAKYVSRGSYYGQVGPRFAMDGVSCKGTETKLQRCVFDNQDDCSGKEAAGVICTESLLENEYETLEETTTPSGHSTNCKHYLMGDKKCDEVNNKADCLFDGMDCKLIDLCPSPEYINDGICDDFANNDLCFYDGGDCCGNLANEAFCFYCECKIGANCEEAKMSNGKCDSANDRVSCGYDGGDCLQNGCQPDLYSDGKCDEVNNYFDCNFDGDDCHLACIVELLGNGKCEAINNRAQCAFDGEDCLNLPTTCYPFVGNGVCDVNANTPQCDFDGGECCADSGPITVFLMHCPQCGCVDPDPCIKPLMDNWICDQVNNKVECIFDGLDCFQEYIDSALTTETTSTPNICELASINDNVCDDHNNNAYCQFDGGDCCGEDVIKTFCMFCECLQYSSVLTQTATTTNPVPYNCIGYWIADGYCDDSNNNQECAFDGGDCCKFDKITTFCEDCQCKETPQNGTTTIAYTLHANCTDSWIGDKYCDGMNNNELCQFDGGDCCNPLSLFEFCVGNCECLQSEGCLNAIHAGDGYCDDVNNNPECAYDNGDCCGAMLPGNCTDCSCKDPIGCNDALIGDGHCDMANNKSVCSYDGQDCLLGCLKISWAGDGWCDDSNNFESCNFDGGDCCGPDVRKNYCFECECKQEICNQDLLNNSQCDSENDYESCGFDGGDCLELVCPKPNYSGDGYCDDWNNIPSCDWDGGDCCPPYYNIFWSDYCLDCKCHTDINQACSPELYFNQVCDEVNNVESCSFDNGDCLFVIDPMEPELPPFNGTALPDFFPMLGFPGLPWLTMKSKPKEDELSRWGKESCKPLDNYKDGICDPSLNTKKCNFDGGDCCENSNPGWDSRCGSNCICIQKDKCKEDLFENGKCDLVNNNEACNFDQLECSLLNILHQ